MINILNEYIKNKVRIPYTNMFNVPKINPIIVRMTSYRWTVYVLCNGIPLVLDTALELTRNYDYISLIFIYSKYF